MLADQLKEYLEKNRADAFESLEIIRGDVIGLVKIDKLVDLCGFLKGDSDLQFNFLSMITAALESKRT